MTIIYARASRISWLMGPGVCHHTSTFSPLTVNHKLGRTANQISSEEICHRAQHRPRPPGIHYNIYQRLEDARKFPASNSAASGFRCHLPRARNSHTSVLSTYSRFHGILSLEYNVTGDDQAVGCAQRRKISFLKSEMSSPDFRARRPPPKNQYYFCWRPSAPSTTSSVPSASVMWIWIPSGRDALGEIPRYINIAVRFGRNLVSALLILSAVSEMVTDRILLSHLLDYTRRFTPRHHRSVLLHDRTSGRM